MPNRAEGQRPARAAADPERVKDAPPRRLPRGETPAEEIARRLDRPMGLLGLVFVLVVTGQLVVTSPAWSRAFTIAGWVLWGAFVAEFALRAFIARDQRRFWRRNWWQLLFLALPFLRFSRALRLLRTARIGGVVSATLRGSRSAGRLLTGRIAWLAIITGVVVLGSSQLLYVTGTFTEYGAALHGAALATVTGEPLAADGVVARVFEVVLAVYSVAVFATMAAALGAFFLQRTEVRAPRPE
jgi:voltage-gated potassium channel